MTNNNPISQLIFWKNFARRWGVGFRFTSKDVAFDLPDRSVPEWKRDFIQELVNEGGALFEESEDGKCFSVALDID